MNLQMQVRVCAYVCASARAHVCGPRAPGCQWPGCWYGVVSPPPLYSPTAPRPANTHARARAQTHTHTHTHTNARMHAHVHAHARRRELRVTRRQWGAESSLLADSPLLREQDWKPKTAATMGHRLGNRALVALLSEGERPQGRGCGIPRPLLGGNYLLGNLALVVAAVLLVQLIFASGLARQPKSGSKTRRTQ